MAASKRVQAIGMMDVRILDIRMLVKIVGKNSTREIGNTRATRAFASRMDASDKVLHRLLVLPFIEEEENATTVEAEVEVEMQVLLHQGLARSLTVA